MDKGTWIPSACSMCYNSCGIMAHQVDGTLVKIEGNPNSPAGLGRLCPKGLSGIMTLYDPYRVKRPLKRSNPEKGIGVDPKWVEIDWAEALDTIAEGLRMVRQEDPRKLIITGSVANVGPMLNSLCFATAFGTPNWYPSGAGIHCGNGEHLFSCLLHASWNKIPDYDHCNYLIIFGCNIGFATYYSFSTISQRCADARVRGMKVVVVDPMLNAAAEKADEWIPIKVGTDAALALAMINTLVNELGIYDAEHLKTHTNAPYLIRPDGYYLRDKETGKPLVWDTVEGKAKVYDDPSIKDYALEGSYEIQGIQAQPAFQKLKDHIKPYTAEEAAKITTIPAHTIRRLAQEFGQAARIGSTINIEGKELPYRPAAIVYFKGAQGHKHSLLTCMSLELLNLLMGACDVPGGILGTNPVCHGHPETGRPNYIPKPGPDGLMVTGTWVVPTVPFPPGEVKSPESLTLSEFLPLAIGSYMPVLTVLDPEKWGVPYGAGVMINFGSNLLFSLGNPQIIANFLKNIPFIVSFNLTLDETTDFSDIVLPDACYLERLDTYPINNLIFNFPGGRGEWAWQIRQPVVEPPASIRSSNEVLLELAERIGFLEDFYAVINFAGGLTGPYMLEPNGKYSWEEVVDRWAKSYFGPGHGLEWFKEHGLIKWPKKVEEVYWRAFVDVRIPIYFEYFLRVGEDIKKITSELGINWDISDYQPLPDWKPCPSHLVEQAGYDFYAFYYRVAWHTFSWTMENPWLNELSELDPWTYYVVINAGEGKRRSIRDGDLIWIESIDGYKIKGRVRLTEGIHPEALGIANNCGHWAEGLPIAKGKGARVCELQPIDLEHTDMPTNNLDLCQKVRIYKA